MKKTLVNLVHYSWRDEYGGLDDYSRLIYRDEHGKIRQYVTKGTVSKEEALKMLQDGSV